MTSIPAPPVDETRSGESEGFSAQSWVEDERTHLRALLLIATVQFLPYGIAGPEVFRDDWFTLRNAAVDGWWMSAGSDQWLARPVGSAIYAVIFGLIGQRPLVHYALAVVVVTSAAILIRRVGARFLPKSVAVALAALWLILPNHTSLEMWFSCLNIGVALLLLLIGVDCLTHQSNASGRDLLAAFAFPLGVLSYEAVGPAAVGAVLLVGWMRRRDGRWVGVIPSLLTLVASATWLVINWHPEKQGLNVSMDPAFVVPAHFGVSVTGGVRLLQALLPVVVLCISAIAAYFLIREERRDDTDWSERLIVLGWGLLFLGVLPFARYFYAPIGFGDRVTVVSGVGGAMVLVGVIALVGRWWRPAAVVLATVIAIAALAQRASMVKDYAIAADDSRRILAAVESRWPTPPDGEIVFGPEMIVERHIVAFEWAAVSLQLLYGDERVEARIAEGEDDFSSAPPELRFDLRVHSKLDDGRLGAP